MKAIRGALLTVVLLVGIWGPLLAIGWITGVLPGRTIPAELDSPDGGGPARDAGWEGRSRDAEARARPDPAPQVEPDVAPVDEPVPDPDAARPLRPARSYVLAAHGTRTPRNLEVAQLAGDERPEIVVGCGTTYDVLTTVGPELVALRLARYTVSLAGREGEGVRARPDAAAIGDVTGDDRTDLVIAWGHDNGEANGSRGGAVFLVSQNLRGELGRPRRLSGMTARNVVLTELDGRPGLDIVIGDRGHPWRPRAPEGGAQIFAGGPRPAKRASVTAGGVPDGVALLDEIAGEPPTIVVTSDEGLGYPPGVFFFRPTRALAWELAAHHPLSLAGSPIGGDVDGDGRREVLVHVDEETVLYASSDPARVVRPRMPGMAVRQIADFDDDGRADLLGIRGASWRRAGDVVLARQTSGFAFDARHLAAFVREATDARLSDLDGDGHLDLVVTAGLGGLDTVDGAGRCLLVLLPDALATGERPPPEDRSVEDAPSATSITVR